ncbi:ankyrin repeat-containing domain protein [Daldinia sp. FL1419]|nr:ankyrin repeat-containing domain protein [Daldinia sp. FL1419]
MDINIQLPNNAVERRRLQNRIAQRRFRQKREKRHHATAGEDNIQTHSDTQPSIEVSMASIPYENQSQPSLPPINVDTTPEGDSASSPNLVSAAGPLLQAAGGSNNIIQIDENIWYPNAIDSFLSNTVTGLAPEFLSHSPSQLLREVDITPQGMVGADIVGTASVSQLPHDDLDRLQEPLPSRHVRRPLRYRRSARLKESLESVRADDDEGWLGALHIATQSGHERMVDILIEQGEDLNGKDSDGRTPIMHAVISGHEGVAQLLLARGARIALVDRDARSVLHWAALCRREGMLRMFLGRQGDYTEDRLDVDAYDDSGWTPLHMAIRQDSEVIVRMLLQAGARLDSKAQKCPFVRKLDTLGLS